MRPAAPQTRLASCSSESIGPTLPHVLGLPNFFFPLIGCIDADEDAPSQKEISHVPVRLLIGREVKQFSETFHTHAKNKFQHVENFLASKSCKGSTRVLLKLCTQQRGTKQNEIVLRIFGCLHLPHRRKRLSIDILMTCVRPCRTSSKVLGIPKLSVLMNILPWVFQI